MNKISRKTLIFFINVLLIFMPFKTIWAETVSDKDNKSVQKIDKKTSQGTVASKLAIAATQIGALRCAERADQVAKFLTSNQGDLLILDHEVGVPVKDLMTATLIVPFGNEDFSTVEVTLTPTTAGCSAHYSATIFSPVKCVDAEKKFYGDLVFQGIENVPYRMAMISKSARVMSRKVARGCLLTKNEVIR